MDGKASAYAALAKVILSLAALGFTASLGGGPLPVAAVGALMLAQLLGRGRARQAALFALFAATAVAFLFSSPGVRGDQILQARALAGDRIFVEISGNASGGPGIAISARAFPRSAFAAFSSRPLISAGQPEGLSVILATFYALFGAKRVLILSALPAALIAAIVFLAASRTGIPDAASGALAVFSVFNPLLLDVAYNETGFVLAGFLLAAAVFLAVFREERKKAGGGKPRKEGWVSPLAGAFLGALVGVRHELAIVVPFVALASRGKNKAQLLAAFMVFALPWTAWHSAVLGNPLASEVQSYAPPDPFYRHCLGPLCFRFNGLLNFQEEGIVRTPGYGYPVFVLLPLALLASFGVLLAALSAAGAAVFVLFLLPMENWEAHKTGLLYPLVPAVAIVCAAGIGALAEGRRAAIFAFLAACAISYLLVLGVLALPRFPEDPRWHERFPRAQSARISGMEKNLGPASVWPLPMRAHFIEKAPAVLETGAREEAGAPPSPHGPGNGAVAPELAGPCGGLSYRGTALDARRSLFLTERLAYYWEIAHCLPLLDAEAVGVYAAPGFREALEGSDLYALLPAVKGEDPVFIRGLAEKIPSYNETQLGTLGLPDGTQIPVVRIGKPSRIASSAALP